MDKIVSWAKMSDHVDLKSDGDWDNNVALFKEAKAKLVAGIIDNDGSFDTLINVQVHAHQGKTCLDWPLKLGDARKARRRGD